MCNLTQDPDPAVLTLCALLHRMMTPQLILHAFNNSLFTGRPPPGSRNRWFTASWSAAAWFTGLLVHWSNGSWFACLLGYWFTGLLVYWFTGLLVYWCAGSLVADTT